MFKSISDSPKGTALHAFDMLHLAQLRVIVALRRVKLELLFGMMVCRWFGHKWEHPRSITEYRPVCARCGVKYGRER